MKILNLQPQYRWRAFTVEPIADSVPRGTSGNLASLVVIWWCDWQAHAFLLAYWLETGVIGAICAAKIRRAEGTDDPGDIRSHTDVDGEPPHSYIGRPNRDIADAFVRNYAGFWFGMGVVLTLIPLTEEDIPIEPASPSVVTLLAASVVPHLFSYWYEYLGGREYERRGPVSLLVEPAPRFWALILTLIFGVTATTFTHSPIGVIVVLVFFKTCVDLLAHRRDRKRSLQAHKN